MTDKKFSISARIKSFSYALQGISVFLKTQHNAWIHVLAAVVAVAAGYFLKIGTGDWCWIILAIALVFMAEMLNTAIEFLCDVVSPEIHPQIKKVKDVSAAAVLIAAVAAVGIGVMVFLPYLLM